MKLYVLDEGSAIRGPSAVLSPRRGPGRILISLLAALALVGGWFGANWVMESSADASYVRPYVLPSAHAEPVRSEAKAELKQTGEGSPSTQRERFGARSGPSSVIRKDGRLFVNLESVDVGSALTMMSKATGTTVVGGDALLLHPARLTARLIAVSPEAAWQSVFGDVANFAMSCAGNACVVRIVSVAVPAQSSAAVSANLMQPLSAAPIGPPPAATVYSEDN